MNVSTFRGFESHSLRHSFQVCRARWGVSGALNLQSATAGLNTYNEACICEAWPRQVVLTVGSDATGICEPRQVRKEAAVSGRSCVPWGCLIRANYLGNTWKYIVECKARHLILL